jgi:hypothetical protein
VHGTQLIIADSNTAIEDCETGETPQKVKLEPARFQLFADSSGLEAKVNVLNCFGFTSVFIFST